MPETQVLTPAEHPRPLPLDTVSEPAAPAPSAPGPRTREAHCRMAIRYED